MGATDDGWEDVPKKHADDGWEDVPKAGAGKSDSAAAYRAMGAPEGSAQMLADRDASTPSVDELEKMAYATHLKRNPPPMSPDAVRAFAAKERAADNSAWTGLKDDLLGQGADVSPNDTPTQALGKDLMTQYKSGVNALTLGALPYGVAAADSALHDVSFDEALRDAKAEGNDVEKRAPVAALAGSLLTPLPGVGASKGIAKVAKMAASAGGAGFLNSYLHNENPDRGQAATDALIPAAVGGVVGGGFGAASNKAGTAKQGLLAPAKTAINEGNVSAEKTYNDALTRAEDKGAQHLLNANEAERGTAQKAEWAANDLASKHAGETALHMDRTTALRQKAEDDATEQLLKQNAKDVAGARAEGEAADTYAKRYADESSKASQAKELAGRKAQAKAVKEVRSENMAEVKPYEKADKSLRDRAISDLLKKTRENGGSEAKLKAKIEDVLAKKQGVEATEGAHIGRESQRDYDALRSFEDALRAKGDASPEALAQLEKLKAAAGNVGERRMLDIAANPPEARAAAKVAAEKALAEKRLQALLAEKPKAPGAMEAAKELDAPVLPKEAIDMVHAKYREAAQKMGQLPKKADRLSRDQILALAKQRNTPEWLAERDPALSARLNAKEPLPAAVPYPTRPVPSELSPDLARYLAQKQASNVKVPPAPLPDAYPFPTKPVPTPLSVNQARLKALEKLKEPDFITRDLRDPALARQIKAGPQTTPMPPDAELAKTLPKYGTLAAINPMNKPARLLGLSKGPKFMESQGGYRALDALENAGTGRSRVANLTPAGGHIPDLIRKLLGDNEDDPHGLRHGP